MGYFDIPENKLLGKNIKQFFHTSLFMNIGYNIEILRSILMVMFWGKIGGEKEKGEIKAKGDINTETDEMTLLWTMSSKSALKLTLFL